MTLCESVRLDVAGKRSFDGCGFRSGCPVASAHSCDTVNHAAITHAHRHLHGHGSHTHTHTHSGMRIHIQTSVFKHTLTLSHKQPRILARSSDLDHFLFNTCIVFWLGLEPASPVFIMTTFFFPCCHILTDSTVIMIVLLVMTKVIT